MFGINLWATLAVVAGLLLGVGLVYHRGHVDGAAYVQTQWDRSVAAGIAAAEKANANAEATVPVLSPADVAADKSQPSVRKPCLVRDHDDRSCVGL